MLIIHVTFTGTSGGIQSPELSSLTSLRTDITTAIAGLQQSLDDGLLHGFRVTDPVCRLLYHCY